MALTPEQAARLAELEAKRAWSPASGRVAAPKEPEPKSPIATESMPFTTDVLPRALIGAGRTVAETAPIPALRLLAKAGLPMAKRALENYEADKKASPTGTAGKVGGVLADAAMMAAPTPLGKTKAVADASRMTKLGAVGARSGAAGVQGAAQHQAQEYGRTGEVKPGEAAIDAAAGTALMGAGNAVEPALKTGAAAYLQLLTRAPKRLERGMNPPSHKGFRQALEERIFPIFGGYRTAEKRGIAKQIARDKDKTAILNDAGVRPNANVAINQAESEIMARSGGRRGLLPDQKKNAVEQLAQYRTAALDPHYQADEFGNMTPEKFLDLRKMADNNATFVEGKTPAGLDLASQEVRTAQEGQLGRMMAGRPEAARYGKIKEEMADLAPVLEAFGEKAVSNYSLAPELVTGLLGGVAGNPFLAAIPAARRFPQVAPALYETGRAAGSKTSRRGAKTMLDLARATTYGVLQNEDQ